MFGVWRSRDGDRVHGEGAFQYERLFVRITPWRVVLSATAAGAYVLGLILYLPSEIAVGETREAVGTVWRGETAIEPGFALGWTVHPLRSVAALAPAGAMSVRGPETMIVAEARLRQARLVLEQAEGLGSLRLVNALAPSLPVSCDGEMTLSATNLAIGGGTTGEGRLRAGPADCAGGGLVARIPGLDGSLNSDVEGTSLILAGPGRGELLRARLAGDSALSLTVTPAGAATLPGLAATTLEVR